MKVKFLQSIVILLCLAVFLSSDSYAAPPAELVLRVDMGCPSNPLTFKDGWIPWPIPNGCDGKPQQGTWLNNIGGSKINAYLSTYDDRSMGNLRIGYGDAICNSGYQWHHSGNIKGSSRTFQSPGAPQSNIELTFIGSGFTAGYYELRTYHAFPAVYQNIASVKVTGNGVTQLDQAEDIPIQKVSKDSQLVPSVVRFYVTGQGPAKVTYSGQTEAYTLESGKGSNPVINAFELIRLESSPRPVDPVPANKAANVAADTKVSWKPGPKGTTYNVFFAGSAGDLDPESEPDATGLTEPIFDPVALRGKLHDGREYFWRVDYVFPDGKRARSDRWSFTVLGKKDAPKPKAEKKTKTFFKVDLALPMADGVPYPGTAKEGWTIWASPIWADMYSHDGQWLRNAAGTGVDIFINLGNSGMGALKVKGMRMHSKKGEGPPTGIPTADPICNSWYESADWASHNSEWGNIVLYFEKLPAGEYTLLSYHNHWYHCDRYECDCLGMVEYRGEYRANKAEQGPMPSIKAMPLPEKPLPGWESWSLPKGTGKGVTALQNVYYFTAQHVEKDEQLVPSIVKFKTDGSPVVIIYEAPQDYWDYRDYPGGRAILNAFILEKVIQ